MNLIKHILNLVIIFGLFFNNTGSKDFGFNRNQVGKLLFVSYPDAKGNTISSSELSEVMIYNLASKKLVRLTNDLSKDSHPSWSFDGKQIIFESRRPFGGELAENGPSHLYLYDLVTDEISQLDKNFTDKFREKIGSENMTPVWSSIKNQIAFVTKFSEDNNQGLEGFYLNIYDLDTDKLTRVTQCGNPISVKWITQKGIFVYDSLFDSTFLSGIVIFNSNDKKVKKISDKNISYSLVDISPDNNKLLLEGKNIENGDTIAFTYDLRKDSLHIEHNFGSQEISILAFGTENKELIIQKGSLSKSETVFNLYHFDLQKNRSIQLTTDGKFKKDLSFYSEIN